MLAAIATGWFAGVLFWLALPLAANAGDQQLWIDRELTAGGRTKQYDRQVSPQASPAYPNTHPGGIERRELPPIAGSRIDDRPRASASSQNVSANGFAEVWRDMPFDVFRDKALKIGVGSESPAFNDPLVGAVMQGGYFADRVDPQVYDLLKMVVLYRMGRIGELLRFIEAGGPASQSLPAQVFHARALLAVGDVQRACAVTAKFPVNDRDLPPDFLSEALLMSALCSAKSGDLKQAGFSIDLARDRGINSPLSFAVIEYLMSGVKPHLVLPEQLGVRDYFYLRLTGQHPSPKIIDMAEPPLLYAMALDREIPTDLRIEAAERAARRGQLETGRLADIYREVARALSASGGGNRSDGQTRALLFDAAARSTDPGYTAQVIDTLSANARKVRLSAAIGPMLLPILKQLRPEQRLDWFAPRAVELALLAGDLQTAENWLLFAREGGRRAYAAAEWLPLVDALQQGVVPQQEAAEMALRMARGHQLDGEVLHKLASVLDALAIEVPIRLWNEAGKYPQPNNGVLPATGILAALKKASDAGGRGEVLFLVLEALGNHRPDEMHLIAIGDIVRALRKSGFRREAGRLGFEALHGLWPTGQNRFAAAR